MLNTQHKSILILHAKIGPRNYFIKKYEYKNPFVDLTKLKNLTGDTKVSVIIIDKQALISEDLDISELEASWYEHTLAQGVYRVFTKNPQI